MPQYPVEDLTYTEALLEALNASWTPTGLWVWAGMFLLFGLFLGSFLNVCIYRLPMGLSVNRPKRSFCYRCGTMVRWYDNLPILSWVMLGGKCRSCGSKISARYASVELLTGLLFAAIFLTTNTVEEPFHFATIWYCAFAAMLVVGTFTDIDHWIIPDQVTIGGAIAAFVAAIVIGIADTAWMGNWSLITVVGPFPVVTDMMDDSIYDVVTKLILGPSEIGMAITPASWWWAPANALLGAAFGSGMLYGIGIVGKMAFGKDAMGLGDVKLFAMIGATIGIGGSLITLVLASFVGLFFGVAMIVKSQIGKLQKGILQQGADLLPAEDTPPEEPTAAAEEIPVAETDGPESATDEAPAAAEPATVPPIDRLLEISRNKPRSRPVHHLPFGPSIAIGALCVLILHHPIHKVLANLFALTLNN